MWAHKDSQEEIFKICLFVWLVGFLNSSSTTMLYRGWVPRLTSDNFTCCHTRDKAERPWLLTQPVQIFKKLQASRGMRKEMKRGYFIGWIKSSIIIILIIIVMGCHVLGRHQWSWFSISPFHSQHAWSFCCRLPRLWSIYWYSLNSSVVAIVLSTFSFGYLPSPPHETKPCHHPNSLMTLFSIRCATSDNEINLEREGHILRISSNVLVQGNFFDLQNKRIETITKQESRLIYHFILVDSLEPIIWTMQYDTTKLTSTKQKPWHKFLSPKDSLKYSTRLYHTSGINRWSATELAMRG